MDKFWMVWGKGTSRPTMQHPSEESAVIEATRLAGINQGSEFFILEATKVFKTATPPPTPIEMTILQIKEKE